eukprot:767569-Hanusia_phi.AAC.3
MRKNWVDKVKDKLKDRFYQRNPKKESTKKRQVYTVDEMDELLDSGKLTFEEMKVVGDVALGKGAVHPVLDVMMKRRKEGSKPGKRNDGFKVALAIEGGGMRGCVAAGMAGAVMDAGFYDSFDAVYGSSAGSLIGAYWIANQFGMPQYGCSLYYDLLTDERAKKNFIDRSQILSLIGLSWLRWLMPRSIKETLGLRSRRPLLNLPYLLQTCVEELRPLDWEAFSRNEATVPLKIVASDVSKERAVVFDREHGHWGSLREMTRCMTASMNLPAIAEPLVTLPGLDLLLADAQLYEPIPFKSAVEEGFTHVLVLRTRPDQQDVVPKKSKMEQKMMEHFFLRRYQLPNIYDYLVTQQHKRTYARDILLLNDAAHNPRANSPQLLAIALGGNSSEIGRLECRREAIFQGVCDGYRSAWKALHPAADGMGAEVMPEDAVAAAFPRAIVEETPQLTPR